VAITDNDLHAGNIVFRFPTGLAGLANGLGLSDAGDFARPVSADLDADGDLDVLMGNYNGDLLYFS